MSDPTHSPADITRTLLIDRGVGTTPGTGLPWPAFSTVEPTVPDDCITVLDVRGVVDAYLMATGEAATHYGVRVRVRSALPHAGWAKAAAVRTLLAEQVYDATVTIDGVRYAVPCFGRVGTAVTLPRTSAEPNRTVISLDLTVPVRQLA